MKYKLSESEKAITLSLLTESKEEVDLIDRIEKAMRKIYSENRVEYHRIAKDKLNLSFK